MEQNNLEERGYVNRQLSEMSTEWFGFHNGKPKIKRHTLRVTISQRDAIHFFLDVPRNRFKSHSHQLKLLLESEIKVQMLLLKCMRIHSARGQDKQVHMTKNSEIMYGISLNACFSAKMTFEVSDALIKLPSDFLLFLERVHNI